MPSKDKVITKAVQYPRDALVDNPRVDTINSAEVHTLDELFRERVRRSSSKLAYSQFDGQANEWINYSWADIAKEVERWQVALRETGLAKGDRVAIHYRNSIEWVVFDQAALRLGLVVVPLYTADRADNIAYVIENSGAKLVLTLDTVTWQEVSDADEDVSCVETVLVFEQPGNTPSDSRVKLLSDWLPELGQHFERGLAEPDDLASIVYTSGTTGRPKGVMLTHKNMLANAYAGMRSVALTPQDCLLSFLPLSHTLERTVGYYAAMMSGSSVAYNRSIPQLGEDLLLIKPSVLVSVPRIFERIHNKIYASLSDASPIKRKLFDVAIAGGWHAFRTRQGLASWHPRLLFAGVLDRFVAKPVRESLGGRLDFAVVGGAPLSADVAKTFISLGIPLLQGYGLTESSPIVSVNTKNQNRLGSIGLPLRGVDVKLMANDEIWVKGQNVMMGYWQNPEATADCIVEDGDERWLRTGDRGAIDKDGFIRIIGRIKDILVLANGEKVPPPDIEAAITREPLFEQVMVVGEGKSFLSVLAVLSEKLLNDLCTQQGWPAEQRNAANLHAYLIEKISAQMEDFPGYAKVRKIHICDSEWSVENGLLTPTLKIKRPLITAHYAEQIAALYDGHGVHKT